MKVVILKPFKKLGKIGDVIEVKDGYGRNFLLPKNIASRATAVNLQHFETIKASLEQENAKHLKDAHEAAKLLDGKDFAFIRQCSDDGRLFGSVSTKEVAKAISVISPLVHHTNVVLETPLKTIGVFEVSLHLHADVNTKVIINIARSESESLDAIKAYRLKTAPAEVVAEEPAA